MNLIPGNRYLFDTTVYIDLLHQRQMGKNLHYQARHLRIFAAYSIITEVELWSYIHGFWTEAQHVIILRPYRRYFLNVTIARDGSRFYAQFKYVDNLQGKKLPGINDCLIAATARFYDLRLVSKNTRHMNLFEQFGVKVDAYEDLE